MIFIIYLPKCQNNFTIWIFFFYFFVFCLSAFSWATPTAYVGSQARGPIRATAAGLRHSHSNAGPEPRL